MKVLLLSLLVFFSLQAEEESFRLEALSVIFENDSPVGTDFSYSHGSRTALLYSLGTTETNASSFFSFAYANQIYTPAAIEKIYRVENDRPYGGYAYIELGFHKTTAKKLDSLSFELGTVGPSSKMNSVQKAIHKLIGTEEVCGWRYQLKEKYIVQLNYLHKERLEYKRFYGYENDLIYSYGVNLGSKTLKASAAVLYRIGYKITDDFGVNAMNEANYSSVPLNAQSPVNAQDGSRLYLNFSSGLNLIAYDIFLDGETTSQSDLVEKNPLVFYLMAGVTYQYKNYKIDLFHNYYSKEYKQRDNDETYRGYSSLQLSYKF